MKHVFETEFYGKKLIVETGEIAKQADGAVLVRLNDTVVLSTACCSDEPKDGDFFPLTVTYEEKQYALGRIPGGFLRREGRPGEHGTLSARLIDRTLRPMFSEGFRNEVQVINTVMSCELDATPEMTAMFGASLALGISDIPFDGPIAGVYVGRVNGKLVINPTVEERKISDLNLAVAGTIEAVNMVECGAQELSEKEVLEAIMFGHQAIKELCKFEQTIIKKVGKAKREVSLYEPDKAIKDDIYKRIHKQMVKSISIVDKLKRQDAIDALKKEILDDYESKTYANEKESKMTIMMVNDILEQMVADEVRRLITEEKVRPDGRKIDEIRPLDAQVALLPRVHGSAMFTRGQTQVISTCTLGVKDDEQILENLSPEDSKRWLHHYNFPPFSVGEIGRTGSPGRREIGHGALGERALAYVLPSEEEFPYTIRCVAEVVESNGSSSQASICASCMALMDAGVPIKGIVSGIAMGLITSGPLDGKHPYTILTDIQGLEDHFGDMDFKVAGTANGITALQMDIKIKGVTEEILFEALKQANVARTEIRKVMEKAISKPRDELSPYAPKYGTIQIPKEKVKDVIGTGGKVINDIIEKCDDVRIDISDEGLVSVYHMDREAINKAINMINDIVREPQIGEIYDGIVDRIESNGVFVHLYGNKEGVCWIRNLDNAFIKDPNDIVKLGDSIKVKIIAIDERGRIEVSRKAILNGDFDVDMNTNTKKGNTSKKHNNSSSKKGGYSSYGYKSNKTNRREFSNSNDDNSTNSSTSLKDFLADSSKKDDISKEKEEKSGLFSKLFKKD